MPHVIDDTDILEHISSSPDSYDIHALPLVLPATRRGRGKLLAVLRGLFTSLRRRRIYREQTPTPGTDQYELSMDMLARKYPNIYLQLTSWSI
jgi:hypothetical protein